MRTIVGYCHEIQLNGRSWVDKSLSVSHSFSIGQGHYTVLGKASDSAGNSKTPFAYFTMQLTLSDVSIASEDMIFEEAGDD